MLTNNKTNNLVILFVLIIILFLGFFSPLARAEVFINEIMYDLPGSDTGREWIEIYNTGPDALNLEELNIETTSNHKNFQLISGSALLGENKYALIIQDSDHFKIDWPIFSEIIVKSTFSLNNKSGEIILKKDKEVLDSLKYNSEIKDREIALSFQKFGSNWSFSPPTPGRVNKKVLITEVPEKEVNKEDVSNKKEIKQTREVNDILEKTDANVFNTIKSNQEESNVMKWSLYLLGLLSLVSLPIIFLSEKEKEEELSSVKDIKIIVEKEDFLSSER